MSQCLRCSIDLRSSRRKYCDECQKIRHNETEKARYEAKKDEILAKKRLDRIKPEVKEREARNRQKSYLVHRDERLEKQKNYYEEHKDERKSYAKKYRGKNKQSLAEKRKIYRMINREKIDSYQKSYRNENREKLRAHDKIRRLDPVRRSQQCLGLIKYLSNPHNKKRYLDQIRVHVEVRRHAEGKFTFDQWRIILDACGGRCLKCGSNRLIEIDHIIPLKRGGTHWITNLQPLCRSCNRQKMVQIADYRSEGVKALAESLL